MLAIVSTKTPIKSMKPRACKAVTSIAVPVLVLTKDESITLGAFRAMDTRRKREFLSCMVVSAKRHPSCIAPTLLLIVGGAV